MQARNQIGHLRRSVFTALITLNSVAQNYLYIVRFRISNASSNLDQYKVTLPWFERVAELAKVDETIEPESILAQSHDFPTEIDDKEIMILREELISIIARHEDALDAYRQQNAKMENTAIEEVLIFFMPYLATLAVSLALFKALYQP